MKKGDKFQCEGKFWKVIGTGAGMIYAECISERLVPAVQMFREKDGEIVRI